MNADAAVDFADLAIMKKAFFKKPRPALGNPDHRPMGAPNAPR